MTVLDGIWRSHLYPNEKLSHTRHFDDAPHPNGYLKNTVRPKVLHYRRLYDDRPDPIVFIHLVVNTSDRLPVPWFYPVTLLTHSSWDFIRLLFLQTHHESPFPSTSPLGPSSHFLVSSVLSTPWAPLPLLVPFLVPFPPLRALLTTKMILLQPNKKRRESGEKMSR